MKRTGQTARIFFSVHSETGPWQCHYCGLPILYRENFSRKDSGKWPYSWALSIDHLDLDFTNDAIENLAPAHLSCNSKSYYAQLTPEQRSEKARRQQAAMTPEAKAAAKRKAMDTRRAQGPIITSKPWFDAMSEEEKIAFGRARSEETRNAQAVKTPEQKAISMQKAWAVRRAKAALDPEYAKHGSDGARKAWETRRAKYGENGHN